MIAVIVVKAPIYGVQGSEDISNASNGFRHSSGKPPKNDLEMASWHEAIQNSTGVAANTRTQIPTSFTFNLPERK